MRNLPQHTTLQENKQARHSALQWEFCTPPPNDSRFLRVLQAHRPYSWKTKRLSAEVSFTYTPTLTPYSPPLHASSRNGLIDPDKHIEIQIAPNNSSVSSMDRLTSKLTSPTLIDCRIPRYAIRRNDNVHHSTYHASSSYLTNYEFHEPSPP